jgi:hypothetical protein
MFFSEPQTLIVVYKDELVANQLRKMVTTKDDGDGEEVVGTKDGSVRIVSWTEKVWLDQKKAGNIDSKVLFVGDIKGTDKLVPILDIKFDDCGVKYGWAGNQAVVCADPKVLLPKGEYNAFVEKLKAMPVPEKLKAKAIDTKDVVVKAGAVGAAWAFLGPIGAAAAFALGTKDKAKVMQQMLFYGIINLYNNHLEEFMKA